MIKVNRRGCRRNYGALAGSVPPRPELLSALFFSLRAQTLSRGPSTIRRRAERADIASSTARAIAVRSMAIRAGETYQSGPAARLARGTASMAAAPAMASSNPLRAAPRASAQPTNARKTA